MNSCQERERYRAEFERDMGGFSWLRLQNVEQSTRPEVQIYELGGVFRVCSRDRRTGSCIAEVQSTICLESISVRSVTALALDYVISVKHPGDSIPTPASSIRNLDNHCSLYRLQRSSAVKP